MYGVTAIARGPSVVPSTSAAARQSVRPYVASSDGARATAANSGHNVVLAASRSRPVAYPAPMQTAAGTTAAIAFRATT